MKDGWRRIDEQELILIVDRPGAVNDTHRYDERAKAITAAVGDGDMLTVIMLTAPGKRFQISVPVSRVQSCEIRDAGWYVDAAGERVPDVEEQKAAMDEYLKAHPLREEAA